jgi:hypothetical protein
MKFVEQFKKEDFVKPSESSMVDRTGIETNDEKKAFAKPVAWSCMSESYLPP